MSDAAATPSTGPSATPATTPSPRAVLQLMKPITWFAPMWAYGCGIVSSGLPLHDRWLVFVAGTLLCGPLVCGTSQAVNDWFDREVDAINEPNRPIPSGRIPGRWGLWIAIALSFISAGVATVLGTWGFVAALIGLALAWAYSAPPFRLKLNGWWGNSAVAACYEGLPWFTGATVMAATLPDPHIIAMAVLYSVGAHGIMTLNDFKSVEGDLQLGIGSLPARLGVQLAGRVACFVMAVPQVVVIALLYFWGKPWFSAAVLGLLLVQCLLMVRLLRSPRERAPWYNATGTTLYVIGMLVTAFALAQDVATP